MTYWNEINDSHIQFWNTDKYPSYYNVSGEFTDEGYRGDKLQHSKVLFLGTCDIMTNFSDGLQRWSAKLHKHYYSDQPYIALGTVASGLPTMVRRLYSYIQNFGAPEKLFMTIPRFDGYEFVNKSGKCYNASSREGSARFCEKANLVDPHEASAWLTQIEANRQLRNIENNRYMLEERFAFIETLCRLHKIELLWTFNPSDASIVTLYENIDIFKDISPFMKRSFVGLAQVNDHQYDRSIGYQTHHGIYQKFVCADPWDFDSLKYHAADNYNWLVSRYGDDLIKMERQ